MSIIFRRTNEIQMCPLQFSVAQWNKGSRISIKNAIICSGYYGSFSHNKTRCVVVNLFCGFDSKMSI